MHIYFSGIGGTGIGPLALIAREAGFEISGSDKQDSQYVQYLIKKGVDIHIGQGYTEIKAIHKKKPIDWFVHTSALTMENQDVPELQFCKEMGIKTSKRDELLNFILEEKKLKLIAIAGTHGKTTTTAMVVWLFKQLNIPLSYSIGAKISFGEMGSYDPMSEYFVYEADEFDRNFLTFHPYASLITGIDYDHPDIYPTRKEYYQAFVDFLCQSDKVFAHSEDLQRIGMAGENDHIDINRFTLVGEVNRKNALLAVEAVNELVGTNVDELIAIMNDFPGVSRRFEQIIPNIYSDYAHTPEKIKGAIQTAQEVVRDGVIVVYEGLHNTRQHFIKEDLKKLFYGVKKVYVVPSYLAREDENLTLLEPKDIATLVSQACPSEPKKLNEDLKQTIVYHVDKGDLVLCLTAGGGGSLDEWLRKEFL